MAPPPPPVDLERVSALLALDTLSERQQFIRDHPQIHTSAFVAALKRRADRQEQEDPRIALHIGRVATEVASQIDDDAARAIAALIRANALRLLGRHQRAVALYERAERLYRSGGDALNAALSQVGKIDALIYLGRYEEALQVADRVRPVYRAHEQNAALAKLDMNVGVLHARLGQHQAAMAHFEAARARFAALGDTLHVAMLDANRANLLTDQDDFRQAAELYLAAGEAFRKAGAISAAAQVDQSVAYLLFAQGRFDPALHLFDRAREVFEQTDQPVAVADIELDKSDAYLRLNLLDEAWAACQRAEAVFRERGMQLELGRVLLNQALVQMEWGRLSESEPLLAEAALIFQEEGNAIWEALVRLNQAIYRLRAGRPADALPLTGQAERLFQEQGLGTRRCLALTIAGDAYRALEEWSRARASYQAALDSVADVEAPWLTYQCHYGLGRVYQQESNSAKAYEAFRRAVEELEHVHSGFGVESHRIAFVQDKLAPYEALVWLCLEQDTAQHTEEAFHYVEEAKSRALVNLLSQNLSGRVQPQKLASQAQIAELERLREELNWYYNRIHNPTQEGETPGESTARAWREIRRLERQADALMHKMRVLYADYLSLRRVQSLSLDMIRGCIPAEGALVEFYMMRDEMMEDETLAFVLSQGSLRVYRGLMSRREVQYWLEALGFQTNKFRYGADYVARHAATLQEGADRCLQALYEGLMAPLQEALDSHQRLVIVPHGPLHYVPFHALYDGERYVLETHTVFSAPSAGVLRLCCKKEPQGKGPALLLGLEEPSIPHVTEEVRGIGRSLEGAQVLTGPAASSEQLRAHGGESSMIHIAAHGLFRADNPLFSALRLADGWLTVNEIYQLSLGAKLVTLSSCETGMGQVATGDELIGLSRAFFHAGAPALVVSLWKVSDASTTELMQSFYENLRGGESVAVALQRAQRATMARFPHPYHWAAFQVTGHGQLKPVV